MPSPLPFSPVLVQSALPPGGLEALLERPMSPLVNAPPSRDQDALVGGFRFMAMCQAPNSASFLAALGKPLAVAKDLESRPGVWWLASQDGTLEWVIFSDCHRKNSWKGGQVCAISRDGAFRPSARSVEAFGAALTAHWGQPPEETHWLAISQWFDQRWEEMGHRAWPRAETPPPPRPVSKRARKGP